MLRRVVLSLFATALAALAVNVRLYLKSGDYQLAREYHVLSDRVRFYSVERDEWEEIPLTLIDLKRTEAEIQRKDKEQKAEVKELAAEDKFEREQRQQIESIPQDPGVYRMNNGKAVALPAGESKIVNNKRRNILKVMSPIPIVSGKANVELDGEHSPNVVHDARPEFYIRLTQDERFGIIQLKPQKGSRIVEKLTIIPVTKEIAEEQAEVQTFRQQLGDSLYKIWPEKAIEPGEYAVVEYTPATNGEINIQVWDFAYAPAR
ncbi:MAG: hypothetical protein ACRD9L_23600 [Bryobacteraceae bacterium]